MEFLADFDPSAAKVFGIFFSLSFATLGLILLIGLIGKVSHLRRGIRQIVARRTRKHRMLADNHQLTADAMKLEGLYLFDEGEYGLSPEEVYTDAKDSPASDAA